MLFLEKHPDSTAATAEGAEQPSAATSGHTDIGGGLPDIGDPAVAPGSAWPTPGAQPPDGCADCTSSSSSSSSSSAAPSSSSSAASSSSSQPQPHGADLMSAKFGNPPTRQKQGATARLRPGPAFMMSLIFKAHAYHQGAEEVGCLNLPVSSSPGSARLRGSTASTEYGPQQHQGDCTGARPRRSFGDHHHLTDDAQLLLSTFGKSAATAVPVSRDTMDTVAVLTATRRTPGFIEEEVVASQQPAGAAAGAPSAAVFCVTQRAPPSKLKRRRTEDGEGEFVQGSDLIVHFFWGVSGG